MSIVMVTGASGFVGREVVRSLQRRGVHVVALTRRPDTPFPPGVEVRHYDPNDAEPNPDAFDGADAVVHLAGEPIDGRWTSEKKRHIAESRILGTQHLIASLAALPTPPSVLVSASAVGYYGSRGDEPLVESAPPGTDFLAGVVRGWEEAAAGAEALGIRTVMLRTGLVLGNGGALAKLKLPFLAGAGGPFGSGRQFLPWIGLGDLAELYAFAIGNHDLRGPINAVAPDYASSARFAQALGAALRRPALVPAPAFALRAVLGEFAQTVLGSQLVLPARAADAGFTWQDAQLESALQAICDPTRAPSGVRTYRASIEVARSLDEVFAFFGDPRNLERITPPLLRFALQGPTPELARGAIYDYRLRLHGIPLRWRTLIAEVIPRRRFVDVQLHGPYALWRHRHEFQPIDGGVRIDDTVEYALPYAPFSEVARPMVERDVAAIFRYRNAAVGELLGGREPAAAPA